MNLSSSPPDLERMRRWSKQSIVIILRFHPKSVTFFFPLHHSRLTSPLPHPHPTHQPPTSTLRHLYINLTCACVCALCFSFHDRNPLDFFRLGLCRRATSPVPPPVPLLLLLLLVVLLVVVVVVVDPVVDPVVNPAVNPTATPFFLSRYRF